MCALKVDKINTIEAIFLVIIVMLTHIILNLPNAILSSTGSAAILNVCDVKEKLRVVK